MGRLYLLIIAFMIPVAGICQHVAGIVVDEQTHQPLAFATIRQGNTRQGLVTDINGKFSFELLSGIQQLHISYVGYTTKTVSVHDVDTIFLSPVVNDNNEVVIRPPYEKIKRIINTTIRNKANNNPDKYAQYAYEIYYKMYVDLLPNEGFAKVKTVKHNKLDTLSESDRKLADSIIAASRKEIDSIRNSMHIIFSETYSKVAYKRPNTRQEDVVASRFSGFSKTFFTNVINGILPFHAYDNYIKLNTIDYTNPTSEGWQYRYNFYLLDELQNGSDTIYVLKYKPKKNVVFNSLEGVVYINTNGYAISHIIAKTTDTTDERSVKMEQIYRFVDGKWFPRELNYEFTFNKYPSPDIGMVWSGHSIIDSVRYTLDKTVHFDKAHAIKLTDSVDLHSEDDWRRYRFDTITIKERNTYVNMDTLMQQAGIDQYLSSATNIALGRLPIKFVDIDLTKILAYNTYEGTRLGLGLYTNDKISSFFTAGGWFGYGFKDKVVKYGASLKIFPAKNEEYWIEAAYQNNYRNTGNININPEIDRRGLQTWLLARVDHVTEFSATAHGRINYLELELQGLKQELKPLYNYAFNQPGAAPGIYDITEASLNLRYAYAEKRTPFFGYYLPAGTKYPIVYAKLSYGQLTSGTYTTNYARGLVAILYTHHFNHWGKDNFKIMGGIIKSKNDNPLPRSILLAGTGYKVDRGDIQFYAQGGFLTMLPFSYFNDRFAGILYRHDFDRCFYTNRYSQPYLSLAYNFLYGTLSDNNRAADAGLVANETGYHEAGVLINHILRVNYLHLAYLNLDLGAYYHITPGKFDFGSQGRIVAGISITF